MPQEDKSKNAGQIWSGIVSKKIMSTGVLNFHIVLKTVGTM